MSNFEAHKAHFGPISQGLIDYVTNNVLLQSRYLFTQSVMRVQYAYCTHCRERHRPEVSLKHNDRASCPKCNSRCIVKKSHVGRKYLRDRAYVVYYQKSVIDDSIMTALGFYVCRNYSGDYKEVETIYRPSSSYVFEMGKSTMFYTGFYDDSKWYQSKNIKSEYSLYTNGTPCYYSRESIKTAVVGTPLQYSTWEQYDEVDMTKFFGLYTQYPCIEYLTKMGYEYFVMAKLYGLRTYEAIKWSGKTMDKILKLPKQELRQFKDMFKQIAWGDEESALALRLYQITRKDSNRPVLGEIRKIASDIIGFFPAMRPMLKYQNVMHCIAYINKQFNADKRRKIYHDRSGVILMWKDYIRDCITLGFDLSQEKVIFPHKLHAAHESTISQVKIKLSDIEARKIALRVKELECYRFSFNGYFIRAAISGQEIIDEGKALRHCVGGYAKHHADGETNILMIRKVADPETPFYTMEVKDGKIIQTQGYRHFLPTGDISEFVEAFRAEKLLKKPKNRVSNRANRQEVAV